MIIRDDDNISNDYNLFVLETVCYTNSVFQRPVSISTFTTEVIVKHWNIEISTQLTKNLNHKSMRMILTLTNLSAPTVNNLLTY